MIERLRRLVHRLRQQRTHDLRHRLIEDVERTRLAMVATVTDARRIGAPVEVEIMLTVTTWSDWTQRLKSWASTSEQ
jgi:hypothetical protein